MASSRARWLGLQRQHALTHTGGQVSREQPLHVPLHAAHGLPQWGVVLGGDALHAEKPERLLKERLQVSLKVLQVQDVSRVRHQTPLQEDPVQGLRCGGHVGNQITENVVVDCRLSLDAGKKLQSHLPDQKSTQLCNQ